MAGTVTTQVIYEQGGASGTQSPSTSETVNDPADGSASGEANNGGCSATATNPNGEGGGDTTASSWKFA